MTKPLQIICEYTAEQFGGGDYIVTITDDHIRAIVERAKEMGLIATYSSVNTIPTSTGGMVTGGQTMEIYSNGKRFNPQSGTFEPVGLCPDKADGLLQFPTAGKLQLAAPRDPMPEIKFDAPPFDKPAAPADDEATVQAMRREITPYSYEWENIATDLLAAIRRGEVPGLTTTAEMDALREELLSKDEVDLVAERDTLRAEVERLRAELERERVRLAGCGAAALGYSRGDVAPGSYGHSASYDDVVRLRDRCEKAEAERDAAIARADDLSKELRAHLDAQVDVKIVADRLDTARAAHAEAMELLNKAYGRVSESLDAEIDALEAKYGKEVGK